jgi:hypothetical protein
MPVIRHLLIGRGPDTPDQDAFERKLFVIRRVTELRTSEVSFPSLSSRTLVYKGMLSAPQLAEFYADLRDPGLTSALAIVHSRFSTNTFPSWALAHPHRMSAHNGEINTLQGNINWMQAREAILESEKFGDDLARCLPLVAPGTSDSLAFDHVLELLSLAGRSLPHAAMMMIARAREPDDRRLRGPRGLLPLPLAPDRALGRPGGDRLHRRHPAGSDARPQRAASRPLGRHQRRLGRRLLRSRLLPGSGRPGRLPRAPAPGQHVLRRPRARPGSGGG